MDIHPMRRRRSLNASALACFLVHGTSMAQTVEVDLLSHAPAATTPTAAGNIDPSAMTPDGRRVLLWGQGRLDPSIPRGTTLESYHLDRTTRVTTRLAVPGVASPLLDTQRGVAISPDGMTVLFNSKLSGMEGVTQDANAGLDAFLRDIGTASGPVLVSRSIASPSMTGNGISAATSLDDSGRYVLLVSRASDLVPGVVDNNADSDVFVFDRSTQAMTLVSHLPGQPLVAAGRSHSARMSRNGQWVVLESGAPLMAGVRYEYPNSPELFLYERATGNSTLLSHAAGDPRRATHGMPWVAAMTEDAGVILISSTAPNLVSG